MSQVSGGGKRQRQAGGGGALQGLAPGLTWDTTGFKIFHVTDYFGAVFCLQCCAQALPSSGEPALSCSRQRHWGAWASVAEERGLSGSVALPGSGVEPVSPVLAGGFFATEPPGKPSPFHL